MSGEAKSLGESERAAIVSEARRIFGPDACLTITVTQDPVLGPRAIILDDVHGASAIRWLAGMTCFEDLSSRSLSPHANPLTKAAQAVGYCSYLDAVDRIARFLSTLVRRGQAFAVEVVPDLVVAPVDSTRADLRTLEDWALKARAALINTGGLTAASIIDEIDDYLGVPQEDRTRREVSNAKDHDLVSSIRDPVFVASLTRWRDALQESLDRRANDGGREVATPGQIYTTATIAHWVEVVQKVLSLVDESESP